MEIGNINVTPYFFKYACFSHGVLATTYAYSRLSGFFYGLNYNNISNIGSDVTSIWDKEFGQFAYIIGHIIISINYNLLSGISDNNKSKHIMDGTLKNQLLGVLGHSLLVIFSLWSFHSNRLTSTMVLFCLLQIGMIYFYISNNEPKRPVSTVKIVNNRPLVNRDIYVIVFVSLMCFYAYIAFNTTETHKYGLWLIASVYLFLSGYWLRFRITNTKNTKK